MLLANILMWQGVLLRLLGFFRMMEGIDEGTIYLHALHY